MNNVARLSCLCLPILLSGCGGSQFGKSTPTAANLLITPVDALALAYDSKRDLIYASSYSRQAVIAISPSTGNVVGTLGLSGLPRHLSVSSDCAYLYADLQSYDEEAFGGVQRFNLSTNTVDETFPDYYYNGTAAGGGIQTLVASPVDPNTVATVSYFLVGPNVEEQYPEYIAAVHTSAYTGAQIAPAYGNGYTSGQATGSVGTCGVEICPTWICFGQSGSSLYSMTQPNQLVPFNISTGSAPPAPPQIGASPFTPPIVDAGGKLIVGGAVYSESTLKQLGHFGVAGSAWYVAPVPNTSTAYGWCPAQNGAASFFARLNTNTYNIEQTWTTPTLPTPNGSNVPSFINVGPNRFAFLSSSANNQYLAVMIFTDPSG